MVRRILATTALAIAMLSGSLLPAFVPAAAASSCSAWTSETAPPPTIRVYRHVTGAIDTVDFRAYAKNVLSREWIGSWTTESLRSGALAVRNYAWYQVLHWRGGVNAAGACFDVRDDTWDQVYDPSKATWSTAAAAVDDTWSWSVLKAGHIFPTYYNAGTSGEACGANANGWKAYQWGTQACGLAGLSAAQIIGTYYYPGVTVTGAPGSSATPAPTSTPTRTPSASPTATPAPTPTPVPTSTPTAGPTGTASPAASPTPTPTAAPTSTPTPTPSPTATATRTPTPSPAAATPTPIPPPSATPAATPPADQELPGGGQATVVNASAPPPPPPANPKPVVASLATPRPFQVPHQALPPSEAPAAAGRGSAVDTSWTPTGRLATTPAEEAQLAATLDRLAGPGAPTWPSGDPRLSAFSARIGPALDRLVDALVARLAAGEILVGLLRPY